MLHPMMPPPMITILACVGKFDSVTDGDYSIGRDER